MSSSPKIVISEAELQSASKTLPTFTVPKTQPYAVDAISPNKAAKSWKWWLICAGLAIQVLWISLVASTPRKSAPTLEQIAAEAQDSVVMLQSQAGMGTGTVIAHAHGQVLIVTNKHVLGIDRRRSDNSAIGCVVITRRGQKLRGDVVAWARDADVDLALLLVEGIDHCKPLRLAQFSDARVGQQVIAIGHPLGLDFTVSDGIVSAKREGTWLQTTAPINQGNSGGPLLNANGDLLAINTLMLCAESGASPGFAFRADVIAQHSDWNFRREITELMSAIRFR